MNDRAATASRSARAAWPESARGTGAKIRIGIARRAFRTARRSPPARRRRPARRSRPAKPRRAAQFRLAGAKARPAPRSTRARAGVGRFGAAPVARMPMRAGSSRSPPPPGSPCADHAARGQESRPRPNRGRRAAFAARAAGRAAPPIDFEIVARVSAQGPDHAEGFAGAQRNLTKSPSASVIPAGTR